MNLGSITSALVETGEQLAGNQFCGKGPGDPGEQS